ncbi:hypothetical protein SLE2022_388880 [Rubroshorea leprosula]
MDKKKKILMNRYEMGRMLGQGTFAKVYFARNLENGQSFAIKIIDKEVVTRVGLIDQIKREISVMRLVKHPNVVGLHEVMASKTKICFVMEYVKGGELFNKIAKGRLKEDAARTYFQQLIAAVDYCHSRGVYHRDLKPENLLLDEEGNLKVSDFGLSSLGESRRQDGLLHTTCGTPAYVAPEVINKKGYDGAKADIWSCGQGRVQMSAMAPSEVRKLLSCILDPNPNTRITVAKLMDNFWFKKGFKHLEIPPSPQEFRLNELISDVHAAFDSSDSRDNSMKNPITSSRNPLRPTNFNAFDIISLSHGFDLSGLFGDMDQRMDARFMTQKPASDIVSKFEKIAHTGSFRCKKKDGKVKLEDSKQGRKGHLVIDAEICEVTPSFYVVELQKTAGDTLEYRRFCNQELKPSLQDIVWTWQGNE